MHWAKNRRSDNPRCFQGCGKSTPNIHNCWKECNLIQAFWRMLTSSTPELSYAYPYDSAMTHLGVCPTGTLADIQSVYYSTISISPQIENNPTGESIHKLL